LLQIADYQTGKLGQNSAKVSGKPGNISLPRELKKSTSKRSGFFGWLNFSFKKIIGFPGSF